MELNERAKAYYEKMYNGKTSSLEETDPEFLNFFHNFTFDEVVNEKPLDDRTRFIAILATLIASQSVDMFKSILTASLNFGVTAEEVKEVVYQATAYLGIGRVIPFLHATNEVLKSSGIALPLRNASTTTPADRVEKGEQAQVDIFGEGMRGFSKSGDKSVTHINRWLSGNCFGDYYTREGLDFRLREMITFCFLAAQGGCEPQLIAHAKANIRIGNDSEFLISVVSNCLPYIGYPRSLNALRCIADAAK